MTLTFFYELSLAKPRFTARSEEVGSHSRPRGVDGALRAGAGEVGRAAWL